VAELVEAPDSKFVGGRPDPVSSYSRQVLTRIAISAAPIRFVPFNPVEWSPVRDQFGDQNVVLTFAIAMVAR
jgi:hypothetical protein